MPLLQYNGGVGLNRGGLSRSASGQMFFGGGQPQTPKPRRPPQQSYYVPPQPQPQVPSLAPQTYIAGVGGPGTINGVVQAPLQSSAVNNWGYNTQGLLNIQRERLGSMQEQDQRVLDYNRAMAAANASPMPAPRFGSKGPASLQYRSNGSTDGSGQYGQPGMGPSAGGTGAAQAGSTEWLQNFYANADKAQAEAKAANEARYNEINKGYQDRYAGAAKDLQGLGASEQKAIDDRFHQGQASAAQDLISRGLGNTTIRSSVMRGYDAARSREQTQLAVDNAKLRLQYLPPMEGERLQFMERRNDVGPDVGQFASLNQSLGAAGYGLPGNIGSMNGGGLAPAPAAAAPSGTSAAATALERRRQMLARLGIGQQQAAGPAYPIGTFRR